MTRELMKKSKKLNQITKKETKEFRRICARFYLFDFLSLLQSFWGEKYIFFLIFLKYFNNV